MVWPSVVRQYLRPDELQRVCRLVEDPGRRATPEAPVARLALEPDSAADTGGFTVSLTTWPDGEHHAGRLPRAHAASRLAVTGGSTVAEPGPQGRTLPRS